MSAKTVHRFLTYGIALVWLVNGLFCKVLNFVPRHQQIVMEILGVEYASLFTKLIGVGETFMAVWVLSQLFPQLNTITQIALVAIMNILEFFLVPDLLLWGRFNILFAFLFVLLLYYHGFLLYGEINED